MPCLQAYPLAKESICGWSHALLPSALVPYKALVCIGAIYDLEGTLKSLTSEAPERMTGFHQSIGGGILYVDKGCFQTGTGPSERRNGQRSCVQHQSGRISQGIPDNFIVGRQIWPLLLFVREQSFP